MRAVGLTLMCLACGTEPAAPVCPPVVSECTPQYEASFDQVYTNTIQRMARAFMLVASLRGDEEHLKLLGTSLEPKERWLSPRGLPLMSMGN